ncbi:hypothetical protein [Streptomyces sp. NPDC048489]|uniref:hypothetical protein n=1 Tax=Streptomyces sp. NPDC048489 TaxID=3154504 RepID=UPI0034214477
MSCALVVQLAGTAAMGAYAWGVMSGFYILDPDQMCAASGADGDYVATRMTLPVSVQCVTDQGLGTELVPVWVNPVVFAGLAVCVLAVWTGVSGARRRRADQARGEVEAGGGELRSGGVG